MTDDCLFCKMVAGAIKPDTVYEDDEILAFRDIQPQAPVHVLIIPKRHIATLNDVSNGDASLLGRLLLTAKRVAEEMDIAEPGYRAVINCNRDGGQSVFHVHAHLLGGRRMKWPPG
ncbi:MAG TPA: histidine triad nucleotide-binding protein [Burkholderiales bacterium]